MDVETGEREFRERLTEILRATPLLMRVLSVARHVSSRRSIAPFGLAGGLDGALGRQWVEQRDGSIHALTGTDRTELAPGDVFVIETPGGGGYGPPARCG